MTSPTITSGWYLQTSKGKRETTKIYAGPFVSYWEAKQAEYFNGPWHEDRERNFVQGTPRSSEESFPRRQTGSTYEMGPAGVPFFTNEDEAHTISNYAEELFGKGTKIVLRDAATAKVHPSWREEWQRWVRGLGPMTYKEFQERHWRHVRKALERMHEIRARRA